MGKIVYMILTLAVSIDGRATTQILPGYVASSIEQCRDAAAEWSRRHGGRPATCTPAPGK